MILLYILLVLVSVLLMVVILMQSSKGGGLAGTFGGGSTANALFGGVGAGNFLTKVTTGLAVGYMVLIVLIGVLNKGGSTAQTDFQSELQQEMIIPGTQFEADALTPAEGTTELPAGEAEAPAQEDAE